MESRYKVVQGSELSHCCISATVIDTTIKSTIDNIICECIEVKHANIVCNALNAMEEKQCNQ